MCAYKALTKDERELHKDVGKYINKQRTLVFSARGITNRDRHLMMDMRDLLPHSKKDVKLDTKGGLHIVNEVADMKNCNNCIFFESRKKKDLYMWVSRCPNGPSIKFLVENVHTMAEMKLTGNCLKGSRPVLAFDSIFDEKPEYALMKEVLSQAMGTPKGFPKAKPFVDHVFLFSVLDNRIWFRNYQIMFDLEGNVGTETSSDPTLVEIGPRLVLNPIKIFSGSFSGATLWKNPHYTTPNTIRSNYLKRKLESYGNRLDSGVRRKQKLSESQLPPDEVGDVFE